ADDADRRALQREMSTQVAELSRRDPLDVQRNVQRLIRLLVVSCRAAQRVTDTLVRECLTDLELTFCRNRVFEVAQGEMALTHLRQMRSQTLENQRQLVQRGMKTVTQEVAVLRECRVALPARALCLVLAEPSSETIARIGAKKPGHQMRRVMRRGGPARERPENACIDLWRRGRSAGLRLRNSVDDVDTRIENDWLRTHRRGAAGSPPDELRSQIARARRI